MSDTRTTSILQRVPVILAVTAASYGLPAHAQPRRPRARVGNGTSCTPRVSVVDRASREPLSAQP